MHDPLAHPNLRPHRDPVTVNLDWFDRLAPDAPGRRIETHRLGDHLLGISELRHIFELRCTRPEHVAQLGGQPRLDFRMLR